jgi:hypothetical protein
MGLMEMMGRGSTPEEAPQEDPWAKEQREVAAAMAAAMKSIAPPAPDPWSQEEINAASMADGSLSYAPGTGYYPPTQAELLFSRPLQEGPPPLDPGIWTDAGPGHTEEGPLPGQLVFEQGMAIPTNWKDYDTGNTKSGGGFFSLGRLAEARGLPGPEGFGGGPSTNNWRLLPPEYRHPNFIMRDGNIINTRSPTNYGPHGEAFSMDWYGGRWRRGGIGGPVAYAPFSTSPNITGWPGQLTQWGQSSTAGT